MKCESLHLALFNALLNILYNKSINYTDLFKPFILLFKQCLVSLINTDFNHPWMSDSLYAQCSDELF